LEPAFATTQLIGNGGFEGASVTPPWTLSGSGVEIINSTGAYDGAQYLSMGNANGNGTAQTVYQTVTLPTNLIGATLSFAYEILSSNPSGDDTFTVYITSSLGVPLIDLGSVSSASTTTGWALATTNFISTTTSGAISAYAGQTVNVEFYVTTDPNYGYLTQFNVDDVSLIAATTADIPVNDNFSNAIVLPTAGITNTVNTLYATKEPGEPNHAGNAGGHSLWWTWTAPSLGTVTIGTGGSAFTTLLGVYTGSSVSALTVVTNSDGLNRANGFASLTFAVAPGTQYYIALDGYNGEAGNAAFAFRFSEDVTAPAVVIQSPKAGTSVTTPTITLKGTASDNVAVASVYYRLINASGTNAWQLATGTTVWSASLTGLIPGANTVQVEAYDTSTNVSKMVSVAVNYVIPIPLTLAIVGQGTVAGATNGQLLNLGFAYKLTAKPAAGFAFKNWSGGVATNSATASFVMASNLSLTASFVDVAKPTLSITTPTPGQRWSNSVLTVSGKAKDNVAVAVVWLQLNGGAWINTVNTSNAFATWNAAVPVTPGPNTIKAFASDAAGNNSATNTINFNYVQSAILVVGTNGFGKLSPNYNNALLAIGNSYTITATAGAGYLFSNWVSNVGGVLTNGPTLKFVMESNLIFTVNFVRNPFPATAGTYNGLFYNPNDTAPASSGFFTAQVQNTGAFTAKFEQAGKTYPVSGQFSLTGGWSVPSLKAWDNNAISLQLNLTGENTLTGNLSNATWSAQLFANRAVFSKTNPAPQQGSYTLVLPGDNSANGSGTVTVDVSGNVKFSGTLGDGTKVTESAIESEQGQWPVYVSLYSGAGMVFGWLQFTNQPPQNVGGMLDWIRPGSFTNEIPVVGSPYSLPKGGSVLDLSNGYIVFSGGGLLQSITNQFTLGANNVVKGSDGLKLTLTTSSGLFQGTATNASGKTISFSGAVLQNQTDGFGQFQNAGQIGNLYLAPQ
jgi:hypothetical protein